MFVSVETDFWRFRRTLDKLAQREMPFAAVLALNATARAAAQDVTRELPAIFHQKGRPTPFTKRAIGSQGARKSNLRAQVFVKRQQQKYLLPEEEGASRGWAPGAPILVPVPGGIRVNAYGNIPRGLVHRLLADRKHYFLGRVRGVMGVWQRLGHGRVRLMAALRERATWRAKFGFQQHVAASVGVHFLPALSAGLARAIATSLR
jgi:hypothetical protein